MIELFIVSLLWSFSFVIIKGSLADVNSAFASAVRMILSMLVFLPLVRPRGLRGALVAKLMALGGLQFGLMYVCYMASFAYLPAYMLVLLTTTTPLLVVFFDMLFSGRVVPVFWLAALLAVAGAVLLVRQDEALTLPWRGVLLLQLSNAAFALGQVWYRKLASDNPTLRDTNVYAIVYAGAALVCVAASLYRGTFSADDVTPRQWGSLVYLGVIASGLCFFLWNRGATKVGAGTLALMNNLKIPLGAAVSILVLKEPFKAGPLLASVALFTAALALCRRADRQMRMALVNK
ncbi:MAG: EamA family transporter [Kiritimatiellia bacterium]|jgi:drug/metabolite transporter (DMT)-like permease